MKIARIVVLVVALLVVAATAIAHGGMHGGRGEVQLIDAVLYVTVTPSAAMFSAYDTDGDGDVDAAEVDAQRDAMRGYLLGGLSFVDQDGVAGEVFFEDLSVPGDAHDHDHHGDGAFLRGTFRFRWAAAPTSVTMRWDFGEAAPLFVVAATELSDGSGGTRSLVRQFGLDAESTEAALW